MIVCGTWAEQHKNQTSKTWDIADFLNWLEIIFFWNTSYLLL